MGSPVKWCSQCSETKPVDQFYADRTRSDGRDWRCKACRKEYSESRREQQRAYGRQYYEIHRDEVLQRTAAYQRGDRERARSYSRRYHARNREKRRQYSAQYRAADPERLRAQEAAFRARHPEKYRRDQHARRAALAAVPFDSEVTVDSLRARDGDGCCYCGTQLCFTGTDTYAANKATVDHITPVSKGGGHTFKNTALACRACNISKHASTFLWEWTARRK